MDEVRYQCSDKTRRQIRLATVIGPVVMALALAAFFSLKGGFSTTRMVILTPILWALCIPFMIRVSGRMLGSTTLSHVGLRTRTLVTQRVIRWDRVTTLDVYTIPGHSGSPKRGSSGG